MLRHLLPLWPRLQQARDNGESLCGVLLSRREGPSYRLPGTWMLVDTKGVWQGSLTAGCLEPWIAREAADVLALGESRHLVLDTREEGTHGLQLACGGILELCLFPLFPEQDHAPLGLLDPLANREQELFVRINGGRPEARIALPSPDGEEAWLRIRYRPAPSILMIGRGAEAVPLHDLLHDLGWQVNWVSLSGPSRGRPGRPDFIQPRELALRIRATNPDALLIMNHDIALDRLCLEHVDSQHPPRWLGLLGAKQRCQTLLEECGIDPLARWVHAPAGLPIHAHDPHAIAISIAGELLRDFPDEA